MKKILFLLVCYLYLLPSPSLLVAQKLAPPLDTLHVAFWPDYDQPNVLVLITGSLPPDATFPAQVTIPMPANAEVNAVARINSEVGMADTEFEINGDSLTLTTSDPQFRVEYYVPYEDDGDWRSYDFVWNADYDVEELTAEIQQPVDAITLSSEPAAATSVTNPSNGLIYHGLPPQTVEAGTPYEISFRYNSTGTGLTAGQQGPTQEDTLAPPIATGASNAGGINWAYLLVGLLLLLLVVIATWFMATRYAASNNRKPRKSQKPRKPGPRERSSKSNKQVRYCHECGTQAEGDDRFCRSCGTELKRT